MYSKYASCISGLSLWVKERCLRLQGWHLRMKGWHLRVKGWHLRMKGWHLRVKEWPTAQKECCAVLKKPDLRNADWNLPTKKCYEQGDKTKIRKNGTMNRKKNLNSSAKAAPSQALCS